MQGTYKVANVDAVTANTTVYTVTNGKKLYVTSWGGTIHNVSTISMGHVRLRDGGASGTIIASWTLPTAIAGTTAPIVRIQSPMEIPKQFSTDLFLEMVTGTMTMCFQFTGIEQ